MPKDAPILVDVMNACYPHRHEYVDIICTFTTHLQITRDHPHDHFPLHSKNVSPYKQYDLWQKYRKIVSTEAPSDPIYQNEIIVVVVVY
jgi:hypothetical protein